ncbi:formyltransferase family protein [Herbaspirillum sp. NPDC101397]|uniref:formyltransferase family protein n=1 Tax=Herbaspirillum sp. NPDC101397 TaxID=3364006 RepID=UPI00383A1D6F
MKILFLTNNPISEILIQFIAAEDEVVQWEKPLSVEDMETIKPDFVVSYSYRHILRKPVLDMLPGKFVNLHISLLPWNRGADPNAWSFLDDTPKGVSIHLIDEGLDTGPILVQRPVSFDEHLETIGSSYAALHSNIQQLFRENWAAIKTSAIRPTDQIGSGTQHKMKEFSLLKEKLFKDEGWNTKINDMKDRYRDLPK